VFDLTHVWSGEAVISLVAHHLASSIDSYFKCCVSMPLSTIHDRGIMFYCCLFGHPLPICALLMLILHDMVSLYLVDGIDPTS